MNYERIIDCFRLKILNSPSTGGIPVKNISVPNRLFDQRGKLLWLELYIDSEKRIAHTEEIAINQFIVHQTLCVPVNSGQILIHQTADHLYCLWSENDSTRAGTTLSENEVMYIRKKKLCSGTIVNNTYKIDIQLAVELFEKENNNDYYGNPSS